MPELSDLTVYIDALNTRVGGRQMVGFRLHSPFVLRSVDPPLEAINGRTVQAIFRLGKRIVLQLAGATASPSSAASSSIEDELFLVLHLMIAGRLRWREPRQKPGVGPEDDPGGVRVRAWHAVVHRSRFEEARLAATGPRGLAGIERSTPAASSRSRPRSTQFRGALTRENHTLKRAPDRSAPLQRHRQRLLRRDPARGAAVAPQADADASDDEVLRLYDATRATLHAVDRAAASRSAGAFPEKVTAFRDDMAVHGRFKQPCPVCGAPVQRIVYAEQRVQLLRALPDRRAPARRPLAVAAAQGRLAPQPRGSIWSRQRRLRCLPYLNL